MDTQTVAIIIALVIQTLALGFFSGKLWQLVAAHERYLRHLSEWKHDDVTPRLFRVDELWETFKRKEG
jgi:hypothetical protein